MAPSSRKRKVDSSTASPAKRSKKNLQGTTRHKQRILPAASLPWKPVDESEPGGVEVISGVDVVRVGGEVRFALDGGKKNGDGDVDGNGDDDDDESSFRGFSDDDTQRRAKPPPQKAAPKTKKTREAGHQSVLPKTDMTHWKRLGLSSPILSAIAKLGFSKPTAIQEKAIPAIIAGEDVIGKAQTGSGKTLAFGIPVVESWLASHHDNDDDDDDDNKPRRPLALVLSPTRELAKQLGEHLKALCEGLVPDSPYVCVVTGGLSIQKQQRQLAKADIIVATPGRLWEVMDGDAQLQQSLAQVGFLVVDEADRLLAAGHFAEVEHIVGALDRQHPEAQRDESQSLPPRQTLVFSATISMHLQTKLAGKRRPGRPKGDDGDDDDDKTAYLLKCLSFRREPKLVDANPTGLMAQGLREGLVECGAAEKDLYLYTVLLLNPKRRTLVFANSISAVRRLAPLLQQLRMTALPLHSQLAQKARLRAVERFASAPASASTVLVATDVAARGLDIPDVDLVIHYHVPRSADAYVHRSGRTARADRPGASILLCSPDEVVPTRRLAARVHASGDGSSSGSNKKAKHPIPLIPLDVTVAARLRPRVTLAKRIADAAQAKSKSRSDEAWMRAAAEDLGVEIDDDDDEHDDHQRSKTMSKAEMAALRAQLSAELGRRVNLGVSERYVAGGRVDVGALLRDRNGIFLGGGDGLMLDSMNDNW
ncbi:hypothetical protein CP532_1883 [Ophiocordyceps camponoti-leonardi (nom. inval.)]|nr:hypothetical protein CP532_1883 [Ophiocordyceps camponoti-leonardi (nom. inval.)]